MRKPLTEHQYVALQMAYQCRPLEEITNELGSSEAQVCRTLRRISLGIGCGEYIRPDDLQPPVFEKEQQMGAPHALH